VKIDRAKSLNELEGTHSAEPAFRSHVTTETHRLRDLPLAQLTAEDLRLLVGQGVGLDYLVPLGIEHLRQQPLASGDFYPGDLLVALLRLPASFWTARPDWRHRLDDVAKPVVERFTRMSHRKQEKFSLTLEALEPAYAEFSRVHHATA